LVKSVTDLVKSVTDLVKSVTDLVKSVMDLVKSVMDLVKSVTDLVKSVTNLILSKANFGCFWPKKDARPGNPPQMGEIRSWLPGNKGWQLPPSPQPSPPGRGGTISIFFEHSDDGVNGTGWSKAKNGRPPFPLLGERGRVRANIPTGLQNVSFTFMINPVATG
jgi:hypothetical protein